jgi:hypothetical protein
MALLWFGGPRAIRGGEALGAFVVPQAATKCGGLREQVSRVGRSFGVFTRSKPPGPFANRIVV